MGRIKQKSAVITSYVMDTKKLVLSRLSDMELQFVGVDLHRIKILLLFYLKYLEVIQIFVTRRHSEHYFLYFYFIFFSHEKMIISYFRHSSELVCRDPIFRTN